MKELKEDIIEAVQDATDIVDGTVSIPILEHFLDEILTEQCNIADVMARLFDDVTKNSNADRSRVVAGFDKGKLCFYELDLHEETVKRYLTTVSLNVP